MERSEQTVRGGSSAPDEDARVILLSDPSVIYYVKTISMAQAAT